MSDYKFWSTWPKPFCIFYSLLIALFFIIILGYFVTYNLGINNIISWDSDSNLKNVKHVLESFDFGLFTVNVPGYSYVIEESFVPKDFAVNTIYASVFISLIFLCLAIANTIITSLNRTYFLAGIALLIFSFLIFKFDKIGLFGIYESYFVGGFLIIIGVVSYYFHAFKPDISFFSKLFIFVVIYAGILAFCVAFSHEKAPLLSLANHGLLIAGIITIIFIILVSHEILYGFLFLLTYSYGPGSKNSLTHFILVSVLYFFCLIMLYLKVMGFSDFELFGTDAFLIVPFSAFIGFYGFKARETSYQHITGFNPYGGLIYILLAIVSFSTLGYFFITYNDPAIEAFQDYIIFSHIGIGIIYFIYILANFLPLLGQNLNVYKVAYKPERFPFYIVRLGGVIFAVILILRANLLQLNQSVSAYMIGMGDLSIVQDNPTLAKQYYSLSKDYDPYNFRTNYCLAQLSLKDNKENDAIFYLKETFYRNGSPQGFIKLSDIYLKNDLYFDAIYSLKEGLKIFPSNGYLYNNMSLLYNKTAFVDSAYIFINLARKFDKSNEQINSNYWGFMAKNYSLFQTKADSILSSEHALDDLEVQNNRLAFVNSLNKKDNKVNATVYFKDSVFTESHFSLLNNLTFNNLKQVDSSLIKVLNEKEKNRKGNSFSENLSLLKVIESYYNDDLKSAFFMGDKLSKEGITNVGYYNLLMGIWSLQNGANQLAIDYFNTALEKGSKDAFFYKAIAASETGNIPEATVSWDNVIQLNNPSTNNMAAAIKGIINEQDLTSFYQLSDEFKYHALRFRFKDFSPDQREALTQNINDKNTRIKARILEAEKAWKSKNIAHLAGSLERINNESPADTEIKNKILELQLKLLIAQNDLKGVRENLAVNKRNGDHFYYSAVLEEGKKNIQKANEQYQKAIRAYPFDLDVLKSAVDFYNYQKNTETAYNLALEATQLDPYSVEFLKLYILQSLTVNLVNYANDGMEKLKEIASEAIYIEFEKTFVEEKKKIESSEGVWQ